ncbi:MAG TPA: hypothetical protein V6D30_22950 [Leptolyngbyaceae cyanobacterium]
MSRFYACKRLGQETPGQPRQRLAYYRGSEIYNKLLYPESDPAPVIAVFELPTS